MLERFFIFNPRFFLLSLLEQIVRTINDVIYDIIDGLILHLISAKLFTDADSMAIHIIDILLRFLPVYFYIYIGNEIHLLIKSIDACNSGLVGLWP